MNCNRDYEDNIELNYIEIDEKDYNERVVRVIKWLLESTLKLDENPSSVTEEAA